MLFIMMIAPVRYRSAHCPT